MVRREFPVDDEEDGSRLETFLRKRLGLSRPVALKALRKGWVRVDGSRAKGARRLKTGEVVKITNYGLPLPALSAAPQPAAEVPPAVLAAAAASIRYEDAELVVSAKPSGQVVHAGSGHSFGWIDAVGAALAGAKLTPVGRLDRDTSGLLALARTRGAARHLFEALRQGSLARVYQALVVGRVEDDAGLIDQPLAKGGSAGQERMHPSPEGPPARTRYRVLRRFGGRATLVEATLETGRTHQIRAHFHGLGHPLAGDSRYGDERTRALDRALGLKQLFLHAQRLTLPHPRSGETLELEEPLPSALRAALGKLGEET